MRTALPRLAQLVRQHIHRVGQRIQFITFLRKRNGAVQVAGRDRLKLRQNALHPTPRERDGHVVRHLLSHSIAVGSLVNSRVGIPVLAMRRYTLPIMRPSGLAFTSSAMALKSARMVPE